MDSKDGDWDNWNVEEPGGIDKMIDAYEKADSNISRSTDTKSDSQFDQGSSLPAVEDDFKFSFDGYDSYTETPDYTDEEMDSDDDKMTSPIITNGKQLYGLLNNKDNSGMATCETCGAKGIRHAFYSKSKRFCSLNCSRQMAERKRENKMNKASQAKGSQKKKGSNHKKAQINTIPSSYARQNAARSFDWGSYLSANNASAAPVTCFKHCPMSAGWDNITVGMKVEVLNTDIDVDQNVFWIATVIKIAGYKAKLRYEGFGVNDSSCDFWLNLCTQDVHPVGWCATIGKPLVPPKTIQYKYGDWKAFLVKRLTGARTLPNNFYNKLIENISDKNFKKSMEVEVVDKMCVSAMRVASIDEIVGNRLRLQYVDSKEENDEFWCHTLSPLLHPVGWSSSTGHRLHATAEYKTSSLNKVITGKYDEFDTSPSIFPKLEDSKNGGKFEVGMKLEAIDPLNLSTICVATVMKVLKKHYLMIGIDGSIAQNGTDWFCYHAKSPSIFPVGFCDVNNLDLTPPKGYKDTFNWFQYLKETKSQAAPVKLFNKEVPKNEFKPGMKLEAVDLMEPRLLCTGTVVKVTGRLLRIHFDGWEDTYDQWVDCLSPDIYPVGWCEMVGYHLEGPKSKDTQQPVPTMQHMGKKKRGKNQVFRGPRKKRPRTQQEMKGYEIEAETGLPAHVQLTSEQIAATLTPIEDIQNHNMGNNADEKPDIEKKPSELAQSLPTTLNALTSPVKVPSRPSFPSPTGGVAPSPTPIGPTPGGVTNSTNLIGSAAATTSPTKGGYTPSSHIPRVVQGEGPSHLGDKSKPITPEEWSSIDVCHFLRLNECGNHCDSFRSRSIDGSTFINLSREQIVNLTGMKVGPSLKIFDLIQQLRNFVAKQPS
ncbi:unnamed protein product [Owenia fusiformis]|uniref:Uncharacterized protein n=1 Tax=Owenia fusiformis TaxID=6347 RepID=A0A8J1XML4_OWEFU|nr:unnamed protein product [Owenia fusiformis]